MPTLLLIGDHASIYNRYCDALEADGYTILKAAASAEAVAVARHVFPDVVLADAQAADFENLALIREIRAEGYPGNLQVVITGDAQQIGDGSKWESAADDFLVTPYELGDLRRCLAVRMQWIAAQTRIERSLRGTFHRVLQHECFTPLAGMLGFVTILKEEYSNMKPTAVHQLLGDVEKSGWRLHRVLRNHFRLADLRRSGRKINVSMSAESVRIMIKDAARLAARRADRSEDLRLQLENVALQAERSDLALIVEELVDNACRFSTPGTPVCVGLDRRGVLSVADCGRGVSPVELLLPHEPARDHADGVPTIGVGLTLVQLLASACGARLFVQANQGPGVTARVEFLALELASVVSAPRSAA